MERFGGPEIFFSPLTSSSRRPVPIHGSQRARAAFMSAAIALFGLQRTLSAIREMDLASRRRRRSRDRDIPFSRAHPQSEPPGGQFACPHISMAAASACAARTRDKDARWSDETRGRLRRSARRALRPRCGRAPFISAIPIPVARNLIRRTDYLSLRLSHTKNTRWARGPIDNKPFPKSINIPNLDSTLTAWRRMDGASGW